jgi:hypothetical protein
MQGLSRLAMVTRTGVAPGAESSTSVVNMLDSAVNT